jgi:hypothetical protein
MAQAALSGSELVADLSAWLAKIMARLTGSSALSRAVCNTTCSVVLDVGLSEILVGQNCIKLWWRIIGWWTIICQKHTQSVNTLHFSSF